MSNEEAKSTVHNLEGVAASTGHAVGRCRVVTGYTADFQPGEVLIAGLTDNSFMPNIVVASAIVTAEGNILSHAAVVARELGLPCVVGVRDVLEIVRTGGTIEVDGTNGKVTFFAT